MSEAIAIDDRVSRGMAVHQNIIRSETCSTEQEPKVHCRFGIKSFDHQVTTKLVW